MRGDHHGIPVRGGARHHGAADQPACSLAVFDHDVGVHLGTQHLGIFPRQLVDAVAHRERNDQLDAFGRVGLALGNGRGAEGQRGQQCEQGKREFLHFSLAIVAMTPEV